MEQAELGEVVVVVVEAEAEADGVEGVMVADAVTAAAEAEEVEVGAEGAEQAKKPVVVTAAYRLLMNASAHSVTPSACPVPA